MALIIFITGKSGAGKSRVIRKVKIDAISVDKILERTGGSIPSPSRLPVTHWNLWRTVPKPQMAELLFEGLCSTSNLRRFKGPLIAEGSILCNPWFFEPFLLALADFLEADVSTESIRRYFLNPDDPRILSNLNKRGRKSDRKFRTTADVAHEHRNFVPAFDGTRDQWHEVRTIETLIELIRDELKSSS
jgi:hypothetical protein